MKHLIRGLKVLAAAGVLAAVSPLTFATVSTTGCANTNFCTFTEFAGGGSITVDGVTVSGASIDFEAGAYAGLDQDNLGIVGDDTGPDAAFLFGSAILELDLTGFDSGDLDFIFDVMAGPGLNIVGFGLDNVIFDAEGDFFSFVSLDDGFDFVSVLQDQDGGADSDFIGIAGTSMLSMLASLSNFADDGSLLLYNGFFMTFATADAVPEPAVVLLMMLGLAGIAANRRK